MNNYHLSEAKNIDQENLFLSENLARYKQKKHREIQDRLWLDDCYQLVYKVSLFDKILWSTNNKLYYDQGFYINI